jgi:hypothetical protein
MTTKENDPKTELEKCEGAVKSTTSPRPLNETDRQRKGNILSVDLAFDPDPYEYGSDTWRGIQLAVLSSYEGLWKAFSYEEIQEILKSQGFEGSDQLIASIKDGWIEQIEYVDRGEVNWKYRISHSEASMEAQLTGFFFYTRFLLDNIECLQRVIHGILTEKKGSA